MATVSTNQNLTSVPYTAGETISVTNGATLIINSTPATNPGTVQVSAAQGTILFENASTTTPVVFTFNSNANDLRATGNGVIRARGRWIHLATGTGAANQTINFSAIGGGAPIDDPGAVIVERERLGNNTTRWSLTDKGTHLTTGRRIFRLSWDTGTDPDFADGVWGVDNCITHPWRMHCTPIITLQGWANAANNDIFNVHDYDREGGWIDLECNHYRNMVAEANKTSITVKTAYPFFNIGDPTDAYSKAFTDYAAIWETGRVYQFNRATRVATFGRVAIPSGSRVFYPNIHITAPFNATISARTSLVLNPSGTIDFDTVAFSGSINSGTGSNISAGRVKNWLHFAYSNQRLATNAAATEIVANGIFWGLEGRTNENDASSVFFISNATAPKIDLRNLFFATKSNRPAGSPRTHTAFNVFSDGYVFNLYMLSPSSDQTDSNRPSGVVDTVFRNIQCHGAYWFPVNCTSVFMESIRVAPKADGTDDTTANTRAFSTSNCFDVYLTGFYTGAGGGSVRQQAALFDAQSRRVGMFNVDYDKRDNGTAEVLTCQGNRQAFGNVIIRNPNISASVLTNNTSTTSQIRYANLMQENGAKRLNYTSDVWFEGVQVPAGSGAGNSFNASNAGDVDIYSFYMLYSNFAKTEGKLQVGGFSAEAAREYFEVVSGTLGGDIYFDNLGALYMQAAGNQVIKTSFRKIKGIDSFQNTAIDIDDNGSGNFTYEYALSMDDKASWGAWKALAGANLAGETLPDSNVGFHMRVRITATATAANWTRTLTAFTNTDPNYHIPLDFRRIDLVGCVEGSVLGVFEGGTLLGTATADASGLARLEVESYFDNVPRALSYRLRKAGYQELIGTAQFNLSDVSIPVFQIENLAVTETDAGVAFIGSPAAATATITANTTTGKLYGAAQSWSVLPANIGKAIPVTGAAGPRYSGNGVLTINLGAALSGDTLSNATIRLDTGWSVACPVDSVTIVTPSAGTYNLRNLSITGTLTLANTSGGNVTVRVPPGTSVVNLGPNITVDDSVVATLTFTGLKLGSEVRIYEAGTTNELGGVEESGASFGFVHGGVGSIDYVIFALGYQPIRATGFALAATDSSIPVQQVIDRVYSNL